MANNKVLTKQKPTRMFSRVFRGCVYTATVLTLLAVGFIIGYILDMGIPQI